MRKSLAVALAIITSLGAAPAAHAAVTLTRGTTFNISGANDFQSQLAALGLTQYTTSGASLFLDSTSTITFEFLGSESAFNDTFSWLGTSPGSRTETTAFTNNFGSPLVIGASIFGPGALANRLLFSSTNPNGATATVGQDGFGIFLAANQANGPINTFYLGYDDQITGQDDDHDDFIIRATVVPGAVPEPATWAMMLVGFGAVGFALRRRKEGSHVLFHFA